MRLGKIVALAGIAGLLAIPVAASEPGSAVVESAGGGVHWTIPLPNAFGIEVVNQPLAFNARKYSDGSVSGEFEYHQIAGGTFKFNVEVTCMNVYDGNRAKIGGVIKQSSDPTLPPGTFAWFQVFDDGEGRTHRPTGRAWSASATRQRTRRSATARISRASAPGTCRGTCRSAASQAEGRPLRPPLQEPWRLGLRS
jgi:hypothetical protein